MLNKTKFSLILITFFLYSCGGTWDNIKRGLTGQKKSSTDEFLVKKKDPLIYPPNYEKLPTPGKETVKEDKEEDIESILSIEEMDTSSVDEKNKIGSVEENILRKIKKN